MTTILLPRSVVGKGIIALIHQPLHQSTSYQQFRCLTHTTCARSAIAEVASSKETVVIKPFNEIPGPKPLPIFGNLGSFLPFIGEYYGMEIEQLYRKIHQQFGNICRLPGILGRPDVVFIYRAEDVETTFRNEGPWPIRDGMESLKYYREVIKKDRNEVGILIEQGKKWFDARSKFNQPMMQPRISKRYIQPIADVAEEFVHKMRMIKDDKDEMPTDFMNELFKWALESMAFVALDTRLDCLAPNLKQDSESQKMINAIGDFFDCFFYLETGSWLWKIFPTPTWRKFVKALDLISDVSEKYVNEAIQRAKERKAGGNEDTEPSVLQRLLEKSDPKSACLMAQDMLSAGVDTTSYSVAIAMYHLSKNPDKQDMLFKELKRVFPSKHDVFTEEKLENMKYLRACLKESARINPIVSSTLRTTVKDTVLSNYRIPKGVWVVMPNTISKTNDEYFPLGNKYIPERWLKYRPTDDTVGCPNDFDVVSKTKRHPFASLPFGFGPRSCIGKRFAELEMEILLSKIIRNFHVEYNYKDLTFQSRILNAPKDPLRFKVTERKE